MNKVKPFNFIDTQRVGGSRNCQAWSLGWDPPNQPKDYMVSLRIHASNEWEPITIWALAQNNESFVISKWSACICGGLCGFWEFSHFLIIVLYEWTLAGSQRLNIFKSTTGFTIYIQVSFSSLCFYSAIHHPHNMTPHKTGPILLPLRFYSQYVNKSSRL